MQRLFSAFPDRGPGAGLLLLRAAVGAIVVLQGSSYVASQHDASSTLMIGWLALLVGGMLVIGVLTPVAGMAATLVSVLGASTWLPPVHADSFDGWIATLFFVVVSFAIALLGPGAFSLDAYLFGRREIVIPRQPDTDRAL